jgi:hypothetical protein
VNDDAVAKQSLEKGNACVLETHNVDLTADGLGKKCTQREHV